MHSSKYCELAKIRLVVGALGEGDKHVWWPTTFLASSSKIFLQPIYPRTLRLAQYHGVLEAARRVHDDHLNVGSFHLFRLPEEVEQDIHALVISWSLADFEDVTARDEVSALGALDSLAVVEKDRFEGPVFCGAVQELLSGNALRRIASIYSGAFAQGVQAYPYFSSGA